MKMEPELPGNVKLRENPVKNIRERSNSYSEAINNSLLEEIRRSIDGSIITSKVYSSNAAKPQFRTAQSEVDTANKAVSYEPRGFETTSSATNVTIDAETIVKDCEEYLTSSGEEDGHVSLRMKIDKGSTFENTNYEGTVVLELSESVYGAKDDGTSSTAYPDTTNTEYTAIFPMHYDSQRRKHHRRVNTGGRRRRAKRVVYKDGEENVPCRHNIPSKSIKYMRDLVNTVINSKWRFLIGFFVISHFAFWILFALIWFGVTSSYQNDFQDGKEHCVTGTSSFAGLLLLAVETQMTIGYGSRYPNEECPEAIIIMVIEIVAGTALSGGLAGLLFSKLVRPQKHLNAVGFSKRAAVCLRNGQLCLLFRVWDLKNLHSIGSTITAYLLKPIRTIEGEHHNNFIHKLELREANSFLIWPITIAHIIDETSPLFDISAKDLLDNKFEIVICLTGSSLSMGTFSQSRTSYLSKEIIWGYRFVNVVRYSKKKEAYIIDEENLNTVEQVDTPLCSASRLRQVEENCSTDLLHSPTVMSSPHSSTYPNSPVELRRCALVQ